VRVAWAARVQGLLGLAKAALFITLAVVIVQQVYFGPSRLAAARADIINRFEQERNSRVIALIHRRETVSVFGVPVSSNITIEDSQAVLRPSGSRRTPSLSTSSCTLPAARSWPPSRSPRRSRSARRR
jgi:hypothetical protein